MTSLELAEAVPLGYAMISRVACDAGVRALMIKGPVLSSQGLRTSRASIDIDVLVDPVDFDHMVGLMHDMGWTHRVPATSAQILPLHSVALAHSHWPCEVDVHDRFPGFFEDRQKVFEALWLRREQHALAGVTVLAPDRIGHATIMALHLLRNPESRPEELQGLLAEVAASFSPAEMEEFRGFSCETGSDAVLSDILAGLGVPVDAGSTQPPADWNLMVKAHGVKGVPALNELLNSNITAWPRLAWRSLILTEPEIRQKQPHAAPGPWGLLFARLKRLGWGLRDLPRAVGIVLRSRKSPDRR